MDLNTILKEKKEKNILLKKKFGLPVKDKAIGLIKISNKALIKDLRDGLISLPSGFILEVDGAATEKIGENIIATSKIDENDLIGFDFIVCDNTIENLNKYFELGITPLISSKNHLNSILKEFNPVKNEGNSYLFETLDKWSVFYSIVRYLENFKFPFDNKNLVKNVINL
ncbi:MAG: hypothetical protein PHV23_04495 [Candidatus Gracilibacteria bacterium]|nr:hypothetical protein [Candidatus Gracilibacteria bacterium]